MSAETVTALRWALIEAAQHAAPSPYYWPLYEQTRHGSAETAAARSPPARASLA